MESKYHSPSAYDPKRCGAFACRIPVYGYTALKKVIKSEECRDVAYQIAMISVSDTYMSQQTEVVPVTISTTELGKRTCVSQPHVVNAIQKLVKEGWLIKEKSSDNNKYMYLFNFDKWELACEEHYRSFKKPTKDTGEEDRVRGRFQHTQSRTRPERRRRGE